jgi:hypothetical protein
MYYRHKISIVFIFFTISLFILVNFKDITTTGNPDSVQYELPVFECLKTPVPDMVTDVEVVQDKIQKTVFHPFSRIYDINRDFHVPVNPGFRNCCSIGMLWADLSPPTLT